MNAIPPVLDRVARAIDPEVWQAAATRDMGVGIVAVRRAASLEQARRVFGVIRSTGARTCGLCDGQPVCPCIDAATSPEP